MKTATRNTALSLIGLAALALYILACTSFSPDDTKVLYPAFDPTSGNIGMAVYDRETRRSELVFVPVTSDKQAAVRAQWLDNRRILITWATEAQDQVINAAVVPWGERAPVRSLALTGIEDAATKLVIPMPVAGDCLFAVDSSNRPVRLNLQSGEVTRGQVDSGQELGLYPDPSGRSVFFVQSGGGRDEHVFGQMNPETLDRKVLMTITNEVAEMSFFTFDPQGKRVAFVEGKNEESRLVVLEKGSPVFTRPLVKAHELRFGSGLLSPKGDTVWASYMKRASATNIADYGFMEIPLDNRPIRETVLLPALEAQNDENVLYLQAGVSHDGSAAAVASTYLALAADKFKPADCALFLVDLKDPNRKVTRVPIPLPATNAPKIWK